MAEQEEQAAKDLEHAAELEDEEDNPNYKPPAPKALEEIVNQDAEDESLVKYKQALLGDASPNIIIDANNKNNAIIHKLSLLAEGRDEVFIDLTRPVEEIKEQTFVIKEGCKYRIRIYFYVQREIVTGLCYGHKVYRKGVQVDKMKHMMGSYPPKTELQSFNTPEEEAPSGLLMRGDYKIKSYFKDDEEKVKFSWDWHLAVKKDWSDPPTPTAEK